jgi:phosphoserine phosphatase
MIVIPCKQATFFDVDDTLVMWDATPEQLEERGVDFTCPGSLVTIDECGTEGFAPEWKQRLLPHRVHIEQLKKHKQRGHTIIVWSAGGYDWAAAVVKALGLENYVDLVISKPSWFYDDLMPSEFMGKRYYKKDE